MDTTKHGFSLMMDNDYDDDDGDDGDDGWCGMNRGWLFFRCSRHDRSAVIVGGNWASMRISRMETVEKQGQTKTYSWCFRLNHCMLIFWVAT